MCRSRAKSNLISWLRLSADKFGIRGELRSASHASSASLWLACSLSLALSLSVAAPATSQPELFHALRFGFVWTWWVATVLVRLSGLLGYDDSDSDDDDDDDDAAGVADELRIY